MMKEDIRNVIKILMVIVLQYSIIMGSIVFAVMASYGFYYGYEIVYWTISILAFLLGEGGIILICSAKPLEKQRNIEVKTRRLIFNIVKLIITIALQFYMILTCPVFLSHRWGFFDVIAKLLTLLGILLGEGGIYLLYTVKPLENGKQKKVYTIVYTTIHIIMFGIIMYAYIRQGLTHNWFPLLESPPEA